MTLPSYVLKDHDFINLGNHYYECSKCKVYCIYYENFKEINFGNATKALSKRFRDNGFYYYYQECTWEEVEKLSELSCEEMMIRDILL